eukprot:gene4001-4251_t
MVGYYESWSAKFLPGTVPRTLDISAIPAHVNVIIVGFARPDCTYVKGSLDISYGTTGLIFDNSFISATGAELKAGIAALKAAQNNTRILLSVGGGSDAYNNWKAINTNCLKALVDDLGFQGVDIDFEKATNCAPLANGTVTCTTDAELVNAAKALRAAMPAGQYLLSTATWSTGMDGYAITLPDLITRAKYAQSQSGSAQYGIMLWSLQLATNCPNAQNITTTVCSTYGLQECGKQLPFYMAKPCSNNNNVTVDCNAQPRTYGRCGADGAGACCDGGLCCSAWGYCANDTNYCLQAMGCQLAYGRHG